MFYDSVPSLRATTKPTDLEATWLRREQADGARTEFKVSNMNVRSMNGKSSVTVAGTRSSISGVSDTKIVTLVKEDGGWKVSRLP